MSKLFKPRRWERRSYSTATPTSTLQIFTACTRRTTTWSSSWLQTVPKETCSVKGGFQHSTALTTAFWPAARRMAACYHSITLRTSSWRWSTPSRWSWARERWHGSAGTSSRASPPLTPRKTPAARSVTSVWDVSCTCGKGLLTYMTGSQRYRSFRNHRTVHRTLVKTGGKLYRFLYHFPVFRD